MVKAAVNVVFGVLPTLAFFFWCFQGCRFRWTEVSGWSAEICAAWNFSLVLLYCSLHSWLIGIRRWLYVVVAGTTAVVLMTLWQPTEVDLWRFGTRNLSWWFGTGQFLLWLTVHTWIISTVGLPEFLGVREGPRRLTTTGPFALVRHPMHLSVLANLAVTPAMTLDRITMLTAVGLYLWAAIPEEEARLSDEFGLDWRAYCRRTPALVPRFR